MDTKDTLPNNDPGKTKLGRPVAQTKISKSSSQRGTKEHEARITFIVNETQIDKVKSIAYWKRVMIKDVVSEALTLVIDKYEGEEGPVQPIPQK